MYISVNLEGDEKYFLGGELLLLGKLTNCGWKILGGGGKGYFWGELILGDSVRCVKSAKKIYLYIPRFPPQKFQGMYLELGLEAAYGPTGLVHCVLLLQAGLNLPEVHYLLQY